MALLSFFYHKILLNQVVLSFFSGIMGALIAGGFSWLATKQAHDHNRKLKEDELKLYEKATALSIIEEYKVLKEIYVKEFDEIFNNLQDNNFIEDCYEITLDYTTIYTQNAGEIGLIKNKKLRELIIKTNLLLKKFIEELRIYKKLYDEYYTSRCEFLKRVFKDKTINACTKIDAERELNSILEYINKDNWLWLNEKFMNKEQVKNFLNSDNIKKISLIEYSRKLKSSYSILISVGNSAVNYANEVYEDKN